MADFISFDVFFQWVSLVHHILKNKRPKRDPSKQSLEQCLFRQILQIKIHLEKAQKCSKSAVEQDGGIQYSLPKNWRFAVQLTIELNCVSLNPPWLNCKVTCSSSKLQVLR